MPIAVQCSCGQRLNVPDSMAGKQGKCPKCQQLLRIPQSGGSSTPVAQAPVTQPQAARPKPAPPAPAPDPGLASLLEEAGVGKKAGATCPRCEAPVARGAVLCTKCGLNFATGEKMKGHEANSAGSFGNLYLDEAVENMKRDDKMGELHEKAGVPWYFIAIIFIMVLVGGAGAIIIVDAQLMDPQPPETFIGWVQQFKLGAMLGFVLAIASWLLNLAAIIVVLIHAFSNSLAQGLAVLFIPCYVYVYQFMHWDELKGTFFTIIISSILAGIAGAMISASMGA